MRSIDAEGFPMADALTQTPPAKPEPAPGLVNPFTGDEREDAVLRERLATINNAISGEELSRRVAEAVRAKLAAR